MTNPILNHVLDGEYVKLCVSRPHSESVPVAEWQSALANGVLALAHVFAAAEDETLGGDGKRLVDIETSAIRLHPELVAGLDTATAAALGLPAPTSLAVDLKSEGLITDDNFRVVAKWVRPGGSPARASVAGPFVMQDGALRRIPQPMFGLWRAGQRLSTPLARDERFEALALLRQALPDDAGAAATANGYLQDIRVHCASGFSLKVGRTGPFDFDPVLFSRGSVSAANAGATLDEDEDSVLTPALQKAFAEDRFRASNEARSAYVLRDGSYIYVDPALRPALNVVRRLQDAPQDQRRAFLSNPRRIIRETLGDAADDALDELFVETEQFSNRVAGVDVWREPVLPWLKQAPNTWLPERFGLKIGETYVELQPSQVVPLAAAVDAAIQAGQPNATVGAVVVPATPQASEALRALKDLAPKPSQQGEPEAEAPRERMFLVVQENFEDVSYTPLEPRASADEAKVSAPSLLRTTLKPHQVDGFGWLANSSRAGRCGVLLADDMGLGKTLQAIAFLAWLQEEMRAGRRSRKPILVVAPTGLLANWREEIEKHLNAPYLGELVLAFGANLRQLREDGGLSGRDIDLARAALRSEGWRSAGVVLTTYETMRDYHFSFARTRFAAVVFDEIQKLKNPTSQLTRAAKTLNADFTIGMTGTPVENRLQDLWSIMDVLAPGFLGSSKDFDKRYPATDTEALRRLRSTLADPDGDRPGIMLRRLKSDHLPGLPAKRVQAQRLQMPPVQATAYSDIVRSALAAKMSDPPPGMMLQILHALRGVSLHPIDPEQEPCNLITYPAESARLKWTMEVLDQIAPKREKALVFVESLAMQERLAAIIQQRFGLAQRPHRIHGGVLGAKRQELVKAFQSRRGVFDVMILSPKAGGVGLTLTAANHVIHLSRWWNPAVEDQSTDRAYRIGQDKEVQVYLPLAEHPDPEIAPMSFDLRLHELIEKKRSLSQQMLAVSEAGAGDISALFEAVSGGASDVALDEQIVETTERRAHPVKAGNLPPPPNERLVQRMQIGRWRRKANEPRPLDEILAPFQGKKIAHLHILDPYAIADARGRRSQAQFLRELVSRGCVVERVTVEYRVAENGRESEREQRVDMNTRFLAASPEVRIALKARPGRRQGGEDFHDRLTYIECQDGSGRLERHELCVERGLLALMNAEFQFTATYVPPS